MIKNFKNAIYIIIIFFLLASNLFLFIGNNKNNDNIKNLTQKVEELKNKLKKNSTDNNDLTKDWKTYKNETYGFEFKYPQNWLLTKGSNEDNVHFNKKTKSEGGFDCDIFIENRDNKSIEQLLNKRNGRYTDVKNITIDGINGVIANDIFTIGWDYKVAIFPHKDSMFFLGCKSLLTTELGQILSTLKFTEK
ncbi:hypothetical protein KKB43_03820 [Patescibacteria group bacterium]|nr:hypothetical protein [Patescibacteria group bacterium]